MRLAATVTAVVALVVTTEAHAKPPNWWVRDALCVHHYEGAWNDSGAPYYGGLQMDWNFQHTYGGWILRHHGTADHWRPVTQILVAYRGWKDRGWNPWPKTARLCGLI